MCEDCLKQATATRAEMERIRIFEYRMFLLCWVCAWAEAFLALTPDWPRTWRWVTPFAWIMCGWWARQCFTVALDIRKTHHILRGFDTLIVEIQTSLRDETPTS